MHFRPNLDGLSSGARDQNGDGDLGYASLLEALAPTPSSRQGLLAQFFEPTDEERAEGIKVPSRAHRAIAELMKRGTVRVVLTTNFDRLMEQALEGAGVSPQVIARPEAIKGMAPLAHAEATVVKLHGDYKDLGTRNTAEELSAYPDEWNTLLRQVFDEYGLIICGWSADWDTALVQALESTPNRRYPLYWDSRSSKGEAAQRLITNRTGVTLPSAGADELFDGLLSSVEALDRLAQPPLTTAMAVARLKRYLPDPVRRIDLSDLVMDEAERVSAFVADQPVSVSRLDGEVIQRIYNGYLEAVTPLVSLLVEGVWHDGDGTYDRLWVDALQRLIDAGSIRLSSYTQGIEDTRLWPALFAMTAMGVAAVRRDRERLIIRLATEASGLPQIGAGERLNASQLLHPDALLSGGWVNAMPRWGTGSPGWKYPASHILKADVRKFFTVLIPLDEDYNAAHHGFEYRLGLIQEQSTGGRPLRAMTGEYVGDWQWSTEDRDVPLAELAFRAAASRSRDWPWRAYLPEYDDVLVAHREVLQHYKNWR